MGAIDTLIVILAVIAVPLFAYIVVRAVAIGWFRTKLEVYKQYAEKQDKQYAEKQDKQYAEKQEEED